eukprot:1331743-Pleurochrysis_carterae.AAC.2
MPDVNFLFRRSSINDLIIEFLCSYLLHWSLPLGAPFDTPLSSLFVDASHMHAPANANANAHGRCKQAFAPTHAHAHMLTHSLFTRIISTCSRTAAPEQTPSLPELLRKPLLTEAALRCALALCAALKSASLFPLCALLPSFPPLCAHARGRALIFARISSRHFAGGRR